MIAEDAGGGVVRALVRWILAAPAASGDDARHQSAPFLAEVEFIGCLRRRPYAPAIGGGYARRRGSERALHCSPRSAHLLFAIRLKLAAARQNTTPLPYLAAYVATAISASAIEANFATHAVFPALAA
jgi:hypothetical protein